MDKCVYVDESGVREYFKREYGRSLRGKKIEDIRGGRKFQRVNVIGGLCNGRHIGIKCYTNTTNSKFFEDWFENSLLKEVSKGSTIIMDNASFHRKSVLGLLSEKAGVNLLFLPPYSPDFNPIEHSWSNMKRWLRDNLSRFTSLNLAIYD